MSKDIEIPAKFFTYGEGEEELIEIDAYLYQGEGK
ncbi:hypothetical protein VFSR5_2767 [Aliivibrio fischeri SR5]|uniref:Uncharacterized protein n=1 Tax=Aliivibrio fischeri SR5 TaxID=1088719 RepID=A0AAV3ELX8_ALIFS|nr:hypothetical protein VFSR5_2767 [Aliivibrio fischeri SR5]